MKEVFLYVAHLFLYTFATLLLCTFQDSLWFLLFGGWSPPLLWFVPFLFLMIYHPFPKSIFWIYFLGIVVSSQTSMSAGTILVCLLVLTVLARYLKKRIYWPGPTYFALVTVGGVAILPVLFWLFSQMREANPMPYPSPGAWFWGLILTPALSPLFYYSLSFIDRLCHDPNRTEPTVENL